MVERDHGIAALSKMIDGRTVRHDDVELAIVIAIDQAHPAAHGFNDVLLVRSRNVRNGEANFARDIFELRELRPEVGNKDEKQERDCADHGGLGRL
jgi:hypothetical protein